jgi:hypothetical protein
MGSKKKNTKATTGGNLTTLKIGSRIRCTDDGVTGRIVWANAVSVKIKWDDGEQVTWKRDSLATRPIAILDADGDDQTTAPAATDTAAEITTATEAEQPEAPADAAAAEPIAMTEQTQDTTAAAPEPSATEPEPTATEPLSEPAAPTTEFATIEEATTEQVAREQGTAATEPTLGQTGSSTEAEQSTAKPKRQRKAPADPKEKKVSALNAAAQVLAEEGRPMTCSELIAAMAAKGYWTSPGGQTPDATLYSAILRELTEKGANSRFQKTARGQFARTPVA